MGRKQNSQTYYYYDGSASALNRLCGKLRAGPGLAVARGILLAAHRVGLLEFPSPAELHLQEQHSLGLRVDPRPVPTHGTAHACDAQSRNETLRAASLVFEDFWQRFILALRHAKSSPALAVLLAFTPLLVHGLRPLHPVRLRRRTAQTSILVPLRGSRLLLGSEALPKPTPGIHEPLLDGLLEVPVQVVCLCILLRWSKFGLLGLGLLPHSLERLFQRRHSRGVGGHHPRHGLEPIALDIAFFQNVDQPDRVGNEVRLRFGSSCSDIKSDSGARLCTSSVSNTVSSGAGLPTRVDEFSGVEGTELAAAAPACVLAAACLTSQKRDNASCHWCGLSPRGPRARAWSGNSLHRLAARRQRAACLKNGSEHKHPLFGRRVPIVNNLVGDISGGLCPAEM